MKRLVNTAILKFMQGISNASSFNIKYSPLEQIKPSIFKSPKDTCRLVIKFDPKYIKIRILRYIGGIRFEKS
ncbi:hypothetical protein COM12_30310 [Bacillus wiedmannii]|nr:hypothetical protein COM12_30310 [Bacillus wiedmannii]